MALLDGPRRSPVRGPARSLVVLLHGYGANGDDLIGLADAWRSQLPQTAFAAPNAPEELPFAPVGGRQWFPLTFRDPGELWRGVSAAAPMLDRFLDSELQRLNLDDTRLVLVGFSQGTMLALHSGLRRRGPPAGLIGYSGVIAGPENLAAALTTRPPVLLIHGAADDIIPADALHLTREALAGNGLLVEWHVSPQLGHGIDEDGLRIGEAFLSRCLR